MKFIEALLPMTVVAIAFISIALAVKRHAEAEKDDDEG